MAQKHTTIELNGKRYDARTGKLLPAQQTVSTGNGNTIVKPAVSQQGIVLDGVRRQPKASLGRTGSQQVNAHNVHAKTERSKTLMRTVVKKPTIKPENRPTNTVQHHQIPHHDIDPKRAAHSQSVQKHSLVSRYGATVPQTLKPKQEVLPVKPAPANEPAFPFAQQVEQAIAPTLQQFQQAINDATSHTQKQFKKLTRRQKLSKKLRVSTRAVNLAAGSLAVVLLLGFITYQNVPNLSMQVATARSGVDGSLPGYQPAGFSMNGPIQYQPGQIVINFKSNSDDRTFHVTQSATQWNSETLRETFVAVDRPTYQTLQNNGRTIFIYGDNATWVDGGVWYKIEGKSALNSDQLLRIASSL